MASIGFENGKPAGSASALTWSAGQFVRLTLDTAAGQVLDRPAYTLDRYVAPHAGPDDADRDGADRPHDRHEPGDGDRHVGAGQHDPDRGDERRRGHPDDIVTGTAAPDGSFSIDVPLIGGRSVLNIVATSPRGDTALATRTVVVAGRRRRR